MTEPNQYTDQELIDMLVFAESEKAEKESAIKKIKNALAIKKKAEIDAAYKAKKEPYGDTTIEIAGRKVKFNIPKNVDWDQEKLKELVKQIAADGGEPTDFIKIGYEVPESKWSAWGDNIRSHFIDARTVKPGNISIKLMEEKEAE